LVVVVVVVVVMVVIVTQRYHTALPPYTHTLTITATTVELPPRMSLLPPTINH
jgi:hypothetical protein